MIKDSSILSHLYELQDIKYRNFQSGLIPTIDKEVVIGVRTPELRRLAREMVRDKEADNFIMGLPHKFFEENQLHAFIISQIPDFDMAVQAVDKFLPYIDNWATCDQMSPRIFAKNVDKLLPYIKKWLKSEHVYALRFAVLNLMRYFLDDNFDDKYVRMVLEIKSNDYYVNMMRAWYFATAVAKQYDAVFPIFQNKNLDAWTHNRAIQKAIESYRVSPKHKLELKKLKVKQCYLMMQ